MGRLDCELQFARTREVAIDRFAGDERLDKVDTGVERAVHFARPVDAKARGDARKIMGQSIVTVPAVAARGG